MKVLNDVTLSASWIVQPDSKPLTAECMMYPLRDSLSYLKQWYFITFYTLDETRTFPSIFLSHSLFSTQPLDKSKCPSLISHLTFVSPELLFSKHFGASPDVITIFVARTSRNRLTIVCCLRLCLHVPPPLADVLLHEILPKSTCFHCIVHSVPPRSFEKWYGHCLSSASKAILVIERR